MHVRQAVISGQRQIAWREYEIDPASLKPLEVLIETEQSYISAGTELANYTGLDPKVFLPGNWNTYPWTPGYANVGVVRAVGSAVTRAAVGDRVFTFGRHASAHVYDTNRMCLRVPDGLDGGLAAASRMADVAITSLHLGEPGHNRWVAVFGLGLVGNLAAQLFQIHGCRVIGIDPAAHRRELALSCGIPYALGGEGDTAAIQAAIATLTDGKLAATAIDAVGDSRVCMQALKATAAHGEMIILGTPRAPVQGDLTAAFADCHLRNITIRGALEWRLPEYSTLPYQHSHASKHEAIFGWMADGRLKIAPLVSHRLPAAQIQDAYEGLQEQKDVYTGVVLNWK